MKGVGSMRIPRPAPHFRRALLPKPAASTCVCGGDPRSGTAAWGSRPPQAGAAAPSERPNPIPLRDLAPWAHGPTCVRFTGQVSRRPSLISAESSRINGALSPQSDRLAIAPAPRNQIRVLCDRSAVAAQSLLQRSMGHHRGADAPALVTVVGLARGDAVYDGRIH